MYTYGWNYVPQGFSKGMNNSPRIVNMQVWSPTWKPPFQLMVKQWLLLSVEVLKFWVLSTRIIQYTNNILYIVYLTIW
jgi:hypothetical protein